MNPGSAGLKPTEKTISTEAELLSFVCSVADTFIKMSDCFTSTYTELSEIVKREVSLAMSKTNESIYELKIMILSLKKSP